MDDQDIAPMLFFLYPAHLVNPDHPNPGRFPPAVLNLRKEIITFQDNPQEKRTAFISFILQTVCGFQPPLGEWQRGGSVKKLWSRKGLIGEAIRPEHIWTVGDHAVMPVFIDTNKKVGTSKSKHIISQALRWMRMGDEQLAIVTNGQQWRLIFAGLDYDAYCEWDIVQWFAEGELTDELVGFRTLVSPEHWLPKDESGSCVLLVAIQNSRKSQADLSQTLGERVRESAELLICGHTAALNELNDDINPKDIYRAAVHVIMRMVVILFAESREKMLPCDNNIYYNSYSLQGLRELLERMSNYKLVKSFAAYPRILALFRLIYHGSEHEALPVPTYDGDLFSPGDPSSADGMKRALHIFETACFEKNVMNDFHVNDLLQLLTKTQTTIRQGRVKVRTTIPVDFSVFGSEYIGMLYEGLLNFELKCAVKDDPIVFLAVGNQPALPLKTLQAMNDSSIKSLFEKLKDTSSGDGEEDATADDENHAGDDETIEPDETEDIEEEVEELEETNNDEEAGADQPEDPHYTLQAEAEAWARHACEAAKLVKKPAKNAPQEKHLKYERELAAKTRQLITKVVLPGEWYLVRWGGTRKGSGTYYTRPQLVKPTVHRTLRPLAYDPPVDVHGKANVDAPTSQWMPKKPEDILSLKVCDPACGSGSFCLSAMQFLTDALFESLLVHERIKDYAGESIIEMIYGCNGEELLTSEPLPCRREDDDFELRTKAKLRRYVVERCIYGVDLDPLAVELCRLSLWIETMDPNLPMTFLDHKIKNGNSLVGAWFDTFQHYPVMAWEREGGDKTHTNGVHFEKEEFTKIIKEKKKQVKEEIIRWLAGQTMIAGVFTAENILQIHTTAHDEILHIHEMGIADTTARREVYATLQSNTEFIRLKEAFNLWCALWFWQSDLIDLAPMPEDFYAGNLSDETKDCVKTITESVNFFHWELEFPDVFHQNSSGFDAVLGNPPWDTLQPVSKEYFSAIDPMYRSYGNQDALRKQIEIFEWSKQYEMDWLEYNAQFKAIGNWVKYAGYPFGERIFYDNNNKPSHDFNLGTGGRTSYQDSVSRHKRWETRRENSVGFADSKHPFCYQGSGKAYTYKMFSELAHILLNNNGRIGFVVPSGIYSDFGTVNLRKLFVEQCNWEWLFGFENRDRVFEIDSRFKFNPIIIEKGKSTQSIRTAFMRRHLSDWEHAERYAVEYPRDRIVQFSPNSRAILEIQSERDLEILTKIYSNAVLLGDQSEDGWGIKYSTEFHMTNDSKLFPPRTKWEEWGYRPDEYSRWIKGPWKPIEELWDELDIDLSKCEPRIAQPPYNTLPIPRADIPAGVILSREATHYLQEDDIPEVTFTDASGKPMKVKVEKDDGKKVEVTVMGKAIALPLYQGVMLGLFDPSRMQYIKDEDSQYKWVAMDFNNKIYNPKFLVGESLYEMKKNSSGVKVGFRDIARTTDKRTMMSCLIPDLPCNNKVPILNTQISESALSCILNSFIFDWSERVRQGATSINYFIISETALLKNEKTIFKLELLGKRLGATLRGCFHEIASCFRVTLNMAIRTMFSERFGLTS